MTLSAHVGLRFRETMSGHLVDGISDPDQAGAKENGQPSNFKFTVDVEIPSLALFLDSPVHQARIAGGAVNWDGHVPPGTPVATGGTVVMYRDATPDGRQKRFDVTFSIRAPNGTWTTFSGEKRLVDDGGFDSGADLSTLYLVASENGPAYAAGITRVHIDEFLDQVISFEVTGATGDRDAAQARSAFLTFVNHELREVYPALPQLFEQDDDRYLRPSEWRALSLLTTLMLPRPLSTGGPSIADTVANMQMFVRKAPPDTLGNIRDMLRWAGAVAPLASGFIPHIREALEHLAADPNGSPPAVLDLLQRMSVLPYYAHPKADAMVGYHRPTFEPARKTRLAIAETPSKGAYDVVIVGAGVAGSLLADRLTSSGRNVLLLEEGPYVAEADMSTDELWMTAELFKKGGLQNANDRSLLGNATSFPVFQGACVGGGGTINNAICFQLPEARLDRWHDVGFPIATRDMRAAYADVAAELGIQPVSKATRFPNPAGSLLRSLGPARSPRVDEPPSQGLFECLVNLDRCEGLGLCNSGCGAERKRNALQVHLPRALASGRCELVPNARVMDIRLGHIGAGTSVRSLTVNVGGKNLSIAGDEIILCAGAVGSSALLLASSDVRREVPGLPIGKRFGANVGCPTFVFLKRQIHLRPSVQISHYYMPEGSAGFVIESWFAPPGTLAAAMPGYFEEHARRMRDYTKTVVLAPLVGVDARGSIELDPDGNVLIELPVENDDLVRVRTGVAAIMKAVFGSEDPDVVEVLGGTRQGFSVRNLADVSRFEAAVTTAGQLRLGTGHPQGGNAMSTDAALSVVDEEFRVRGISNLRICDASVFPAVAGVNPQWTVMALAHHLGRRMEGQP